MSKRISANNSNSSPYAKKKSASKVIKPKQENEKLIKCKLCLNIQTKTVFPFTCNHQLCGVCISHLLIHEDFKSLSEKEEIFLDCSICKSKKAQKIGVLKTTLADISKILEETEPIRTEKKKDLCTVHNKISENYCIQCKKWLCIDCKNLFHNSYFKEHTLALEEPFEYKICKTHPDKIMDLFCNDCQEEVCYVCGRSGENHEGHKIITMNEFRSNILKSKRRFKYKNYLEFEDFFKNSEKEFKKNFEKSFNKKTQIINDIKKIFENLEKEITEKKTERENFIENYFKVIKLCYFNYYNDLKIKDPIINNLNFIKSVNKELLSINFKSDYTDVLENISDLLKDINPKRFFKYEMKFLHHSLNCIKTIKEKCRISCLTQLKNGNIVTGGSDGLLNVWDLETLKKVDCFKAHEKNVYSVIQLSDGRLVSSSSDLWIKFFDFDNVTQLEPKKFDIIDQNKLNEIKMKKLKPKKLKINNLEQEKILLRAPGKENNNINNNNNNIINTNINNNNPENKQVININTNPNQNLNSQIPTNIKIPNNINLNSNNAQDVSLSGGGINNPPIINPVSPNPMDVPHGGSGQSQPIQKPPSNIGYSGNGITNPVIKDPTNVAFTGGDQQKPNNIIVPSIPQKIPDAPFGDSNVTNQQSQANPFGNNNFPNNNQGMGTQNVGYSGNGVTNPMINNGDVAYGAGAQISQVTNSQANVEQSVTESKVFGNNFDMDGIEDNKDKGENKLKESEVIPDESISGIHNANPPKNPSGSDDKAIIDTKGNRCLIAIRGHYDDIYCLLETSKRQLVSCSKDGTILVWSIDDLCKKYNFKAHEKGVGCAIEIGENKIATGGADCKIKIWDLSSNPENNSEVLSGHKNTVFSLCKINDNLIASASCDRSIRIWDILEKQCKNIFEGHMGYVWSVVKLKDDNRIATCSSDRMIKIWDLDETKCINTIQAHNEDITTLGVLSDGKLVSGGADMKIKIWEC